jgi:hypothetical protein
MQMKRAAILVSALAVVLYTVGVGAQAKPSFAGKWMMEAPAGGGAPGGGAPGGGAPGGGGGGRGGRGGGGPVSGMEVTITQDANTLTINKTLGQNPVTLKYTLDGSESKNTMMGRGGEVTQTSKAMWEGSKLTISTTAPGRGGDMMTTKQTLSLEGGNLVVENMGADGTSMGKVTYKKGM